jgi:hypothetical protein
MLSVPELKGRPFPSVSGAVMMEGTAKIAVDFPAAARSL